MEFAGTRGINEFDRDVLSDPFHVMVGPVFKSIGGGLPATLCHGTVVSAACGVAFDLVGLAPHDVDPAAVRSPSGYAGGEPFVGIGNSAVVLFLELVLDGIRGRIAPLPKRLDELLALFVGLQLKEG